MRCLVLAFVGLAVGIAVAQADPNDLSDGVLIVHHPPGFCYSSVYTGYCAYYLGHFAIQSCEEQSPFVEGGYFPYLCAWFVLAQWNEEKSWRGTEFGFGDYNPDLFIILNHGPCVPGGFLEIPTSNWPGPNEGTIVTTTDIPWQGNFVPVYYFAGYEYLSPGRIPIEEDPSTGFAGFINGLNPPVEYEAECLPAMGVGTMGERCCSEDLPFDYPCCLGDECFQYTSEECAAAGGSGHPEWDDCVPLNPCLVRACCVGLDCYEVSQRTCHEMGGRFQFETLECDVTVCDPPVAACCLDGGLCAMLTESECTEVHGDWREGQTCEPINPCDPMPALPYSWGKIKASYR